MLSQLMQQQNVPFRYRLSVGTNGNYFCIVIDSLAYGKLLQMAPQIHKFLKLIQSDARVDEFAYPQANANNWGFGNAINVVQIRGDRIRLSLNIPAIDWQTSDYSASGFASARNVSASLAAICKILDWIELPPSSTEQWQLIHYELTTGFGDNGCSIHAYLAPVLVSWIAKNSAAIPSSRITNAMCEVFSFLGQKNGISQRFGFEADPSGAITLQVPGDRSDLFTKTVDAGRGAVACDHNIDNVSQQFALIAGLATLGEIAAVRLSP